MLVSGGGGGLDLNWFLQFLFTLFIIAVGLLHLVKNTASKYFEVDANFESTPPRDSAIVVENSSSTTTNNSSSSSSSSSSDHIHLSSPMPNEDTACAHCRNPATKKCSGCKAVRYCSHKCQEAHWKSGHKTKCKDLRPPGVNSTAGSGRKTSGLGGKICSGIALVPAHGRGISKLIKQPKKILFPYEEFVNFFNWDKPGFPPCGLLNCGNSCYANVVLQCLAFTRPLVAYLLEKGHRSECNRGDWCFLCEFQTHVEKASQSLQAFSPINILSRLPNIGGNLGYGRQEDAHEFMRFAIDTMQSVCLDEFGGEKAVDSSSQETTLIQHIFGGHLQSQVICTKCSNISNQYESMMDLTVEIHGDAASLEECLEQFTAKECLNGENMYKCDCCNDYVKAWKRLTVKKAPNILTIALKRFQIEFENVSQNSSLSICKFLQSGRFGKLNKRVTFPETLNLSPYMSEPGDGTDVYKLYAVVVHLDLLNASFYGHYNCYTKDFRGNWYKIDDCKVTSVELKEVLSQEAYMLFYCRVSARPSCLRPIEPSVEQQQQMVQVTAAPCLKEQVECSTTVESLNHMNGFAVSSDDSSPCPKVSSCEEESSTGINPVALKENHQDVEVVYVESSSVSKEVASCETDSYFGISIEDLREEPEDINTTNSGSHSPISVEFSSHEKESSAAFNSVAGREDPVDVNMADSEWCSAELKEVSCSEMDPVSMDCKFVREDSGDKEVESRPSVAKHAEVYGNGHIDQNEIPCREEHAHKPVSAETHKLKDVRPLHNSDCENGNGAERVGIMGDSF
ncbi:ubiquitin carboxyl-terminal hydrolase 18-like isoform X1 [Quercus robur]|uniref:ubiquitin carboxyl-terminal hydrolase 18-like isoform X1 n=1 Tax=Quercus robur TaxID=38942 RepID=UPI00216286B5|nr:ubiquitin carboxyl-terminal hydrolase 18-like isoform X1 [Quercus robur]